MKLSVVGCGNLGSALIRGLLREGVVSASKLTACDKDEGKLTSLKTDLGISVSTEIAAAVNESEVIVLAVKPNDVANAVFAATDSGVSLDGKILLSVAAGVSVSTIQKVAGSGCDVARAMPNVASLVGKGVTGIYAPSKAAAEAADKVFAALGITQIVSKEDELNAITGLSASGPAYVFTVIEALADGGVKAGLTKAVALRLATQTVLGSAALVDEYGKSPAALRDMVTSPGGTTIAGLHELEKAGIRSAFMSAVEAGFERARELQK